MDLGPLRQEDQLLQLRVLRFGFLQDGDIGVGVFPQREEILVSGERPDAGGIGICSLRASRLQSVPGLAWLSRVLIRI